MAMKGAFCKLCDCEVEEKPCAKCVQLYFLCEGTCVCCEDYRKKQIEQSKYATSSYRNGDSFCKDCGREKCSCLSCRRSNNKCPGTCRCGEKPRKKQAHKQRLTEITQSSGKSKDTSTSSESVSQSNPDDGFCEICQCGPVKSPCRTCEKDKYICPGTCRCCEDFRTKKVTAKLLEYMNRGVLVYEECTSTSGESLTTSNPDDGFCKDCRCGPEKSPCEDCKKREYNCPGTSKCCEKHRKEEASEEDLSKVAARLRDYLNKGVLLYEECPSTSSEYLTTSNPDDGFCKDCQCGPEKSSCVDCTKGEYNCPGTSKCCEKHRKEDASEDLSKVTDNLEIMSFMHGLTKGLEGSEFKNILNPDGGYCKDCECGPMNSPCLLCIRKGKTCLGTCSCCKKGRKARLRRRDSKKK